jgi:hypothetical protein
VHAGGTLGPQVAPDRRQAFRAAQRVPIAHLPERIDRLAERIAQGDFCPFRQRPPLGLSRLGR